MQKWTILPKHDLGDSEKSAGMDVRRATSIWKIKMNPHDIEMEDISNVYFDTILGVSNMR